MVNMFDWMRNRMGKKKSSEVAPDVKKQQLINDAETVLGILRNTWNYTGCAFNEVMQKFYARKGVVGEERVLSALRLLVKAGLIGWGGNRGDHIGFNRERLPTRLPLIEV